MRRFLTTCLALVAVGILAPAAVLAAAPGQAQAPGEGALPYLLVGAIAVWAAFFAYAFYVERKGAALQREVDDLRRALRSQGDRSA